MGVNLRDLVTPVKVSLKALSGKTIAVDAYNALYQFLAIIRGEAGEPLMDSQGRITSHLSGLFYRTLNLLSEGVKLIYVFDGVPPSLKAAEIARRRAVKDEATQKYVEALKRGDLAEAKKYAQATSMIKDYMVDDAKRLLRLLGVPYVDAPSEGEATAAYLTQKKMADMVASQDFDSLLFGATCLIRNLTISGRRKLPNKPVYVEVEPELITLNELLTQLGLTREQLIDVAILIGTDFNPDGFEGIGPATALKLVKQYGRLENIPSLQEKLKEVDYNQIREIFLKPALPARITLEWGAVDEQGLIDFLCRERDFSVERVTNALSRYKEAQARSASSLEKWFRA
ncbi:MAG: flap endonuclease-1 [Nitrososphaerota archaeon]